MSEKKNEENFYEVEKILNRRKVRGKFQYLIKWKGYSMNECTWEPLSNLENIKYFVDKFDAEMDGITYNDDNKENENKEQEESGGSIESKEEKQKENIKVKEKGKRLNNKIGQKGKRTIKENDEKVDDDINENKKNKNKNKRLLRKKRNLTDEEIDEKKDEKEKQKFKESRRNKERKGSEESKDSTGRKESIDSKDEEINSKKSFIIDETYKNIVGIKCDKTQIMALVERKINNENRQETISTKELRKINPWLLIDYYETKINFQ